MGSSQELYDRMSQKMMAMCADKTTNIKQLVNLIWLVVEVINSRSIALSKIANSLPGDAEAESRVRAKGRNREITLNRQQNTLDFQDVGRFEDSMSQHLFGQHVNHNTISIILAEKAIF